MPSRITGTRTAKALGAVPTSRGDQRRASIEDGANGVGLGCRPGRSPAGILGVEDASPVRRVEPDGEPRALPRRNPPELAAKRLAVGAVEGGRRGDRLQGADVVAEVVLDRDRDRARGVPEPAPLGVALLVRDRHGQPDREERHRQHGGRHQEGEVRPQREAEPAQRAAHAGDPAASGSAPAAAVS
jgi:hypothetical protein